MRAGEVVQRREGRLYLCAVGGAACLACLPAFRNLSSRQACAAAEAAAIEVGLSLKSHWVSTPMRPCRLPNMVGVDPLDLLLRGAVG